jgi:endonuclease YncB( thermonuclease family)
MSVIGMKFTLRAAVAVLVAGALLQAAPSASSGAAREACFVVKAIDGDTLVVRLRGRRDTVRLIGVDTPEAAHAGKLAEPFAERATAFTRNRVEGKAVLLVPEPGGEDRDAYGRLLRYVELPDGVSLNAELLRQGYALVYGRSPFTRIEEFRRHEREARERGQGLWAEAARPVPWREAETRVGRLVTVEGTIVAAHRSEKACFLNFDRDWRRRLTVVILEPDLERFPPHPELHYRGKRVRVTGLVSSHRGRPEIVLEDPHRIAIVD